jgi:hypothetical protein
VSAVDVVIDPHRRPGVPRIPDLGSVPLADLVSLDVVLGRHVRPVRTITLAPGSKFGSAI